EGSGDIVFHREVQSLVPFPPALDLDMDSFNLYNCKSWGHKPKANDICLFPSVVSHSVDPNESNEERWSLAFNVFVRGSFGPQHLLNIKSHSTRQSHADPSRDEPDVLVRLKARWNLRLPPMLAANN